MSLFDTFADDDSGSMEDEDQEAEASVAPTESSDIQQLGLSARTQWIALIQAIRRELTEPSFTTLSMFTTQP